MSNQPASPQASSKTRRGGSRGRRREKANIRTPMLKTLKRNLPVVEPLSMKQIEKIDHESMRILEEVGCDFRDPLALEQWKAAGAKIDGERVYADRGLIRELIQSIPTDITLHARDPEKTVQLGGPHSIFVPMTGAPFLRDLEDVRRHPTLDDLAMFHKLSHMLPAIHSSAHHIVEPMDHVVAHLHLRITYSSMKHSDLFNSRAFLSTQKL